MVGTNKIVIMITLLSPLPSSPLSVRSFEKSNSLNLILIIGNIILMLKIVHKKMVMLTIWLLNIDCLCKVAFHLRTSFSSNTGFHVFDRSAMADAWKIKNDKIVKIIYRNWLHFAVETVQSL